MFGGGRAELTRYLNQLTGAAAASGAAAGDFLTAAGSSAQAAGAV